jgi:hypothetical protein
MILCDIPLKKTRAIDLDSEFFLILAMNRVENNKKIQIFDDEEFLTSVEPECFLFVMNRIENNKKIPALFEIIEI